METELNKITITDKLIAKTILPFVPRIVTPNHLTAFRLAATPFVLYLLTLGEYQWGLVLFIITAFSDAVDGALARVRGLVTEWGKMYDPLADKFLIGSVTALIVAKFLDQWLALSIIGLELFLIIGAFWRRRYRKIEIKAKKVGKVKMVLQSLGVGLLLLSIVLGGQPILLEAARYTLILGLAFAVLSLVVYRSI